MRFFYIVVIIQLAAGSLISQNISDVVRWSSIDQIGSARILGTGSAFGAMGGDFSVININPAGIADYRKSEFTFTPSFKTNRTNSAFVNDLENNSVRKGTKLGIDNIGFVFTSNPGTNWTTSNFAIGFSRIADLNRNFQVKGKIQGSITNYFAEQANGIAPNNLDDFITFPAYETGAIFDFENDNFYETDINPNQFVARNQIVNQSGGINELTFGWAGEYKNQLNVGISMGIPFASFEESKTYVESDPDDEISIFRGLEYIENISTSGVGINFKTGFTYKILNKFRIAGTFHSPTWYKFTDNYNTSIEYSFVDNQSNVFKNESPDGTFEYRITTPWRAIGSVGTTYNLGEVKGFIDLDIEYLDYTDANYNGTAYSSSPAEERYTNQVNGEILEKLGSAVNFRLGTEIAIQHLRLRAGYSWERSAFIADDFFNNKVSFGIGFRDDSFFIDLGMRFSEQMDGYNPYVLLDPALDPLANINTNRTRGALTLGFKF